MVARPAIEPGRRPMDSTKANGFNGRTGPLGGRFGRTKRRWRPLYSIAVSLMIVPLRMTARAYRLIAFVLLLAFMLGGAGHSGRGLVSMIGGEGAATNAVGRSIGGLHDLCVTPRSDDLAVRQVQSPPTWPADSDNSPTDAHEHCAECLVRAVDALPWPVAKPLERASVSVLTRAGPSEAPKSNAPSTAAHGARAPPAQIA